jgi:ATP/maltotriose-dependent transcriptional regulator MalT/DNA-binding SARP family transcriptional activator
MKKVALQEEHPETETPVAADVSFAKVSPPRLVSYFPRQQLFQKLDSATEKKLVWVSGPAGCGKTTLLASYLEERSIPSLWYRVDEGDADMASFFYFMKHAAENKNPAIKPALPNLTPEYFVGIQAFSRNFFRNLFNLLPKPHIIIFDNFQDAPKQSQLISILNSAYNELPHGIEIICLSRNEPPPELSKLNIYGTFERLKWDDLLLNEKEAKNFAEHLGYHKIPDKTFDKIYNLTQGWIAGLILLFEHSNRVKDGELFINRGSNKLLFDFFADEIFSRLDAQTKVFLLKISFLPTLSFAITEKITSFPDAWKILTRSIEKNYFIIQHHQDSFTFHPLFREFLLAKASELLNEEEIKDVQLQSAEILIENNLLDEAATLLIQLHKWDTLTELITRNALKLISEGRYITLKSWLEKIPSSVVNATPWILFWLGASYLPFDTKKCRSLLKKAYLLFKKEKNLTNTFLTWVSFVDTYQYLWDDFSVLDYWVDELHELQKSCPNFPNQEIEARATGGIFTALMWRSPDNKKMDYWANRAEQIINLKINPSYRMRVGNNLLLYTLWWKGDFSKATILMNQIGKVVDEAPVEPLVQLTWKVAEAAYFAMINRHADCINAVNDGLKLAAETGIYIANKGLYLQGVYGCLAQGNLSCASDYLEKSLKTTDKAAHFDMAHLYHLASWIAICRNDLASAQQYAKLSVKKSLLCGASMAPPWTHHTLAQIEIENGNFSEAVALINKALDWADSVDCSLLKHHCLLSLAYNALQAGKERHALQHLKSALRLGREQGYISHPWIGWRKEVMTELYMKALAYDIETEYVQKLIRDRKIVPDVAPIELEKWPWPVKIYTLGRFSLVVDGEPVQHGRKGQKKPLEFLKAIIALGGRDISAEKLCDMMWPDADGDSANRSFNTTLHRLRKLIGYDDAVQVNEGRVSLNTLYCWVDAWSFEKKMNQLNKNDSKKKSKKEITIQQSKEIQELYQGNFLERESESFWTLSMRERLRSGFLQSIEKIGEELEKTGEYLDALHLYQKGTEVDDLSEKLYRKMMSLHARQGNKTEALRWYEKCRITLKNILDIPPSPETEKIHTAIKNQDLNFWSRE